MRRKTKATLGLLLVLGAGPVLAADPSVQQDTRWVIETISGLEGDIAATSARWVGPLQEQARRLLFLLLGIALAVRFGMMVFRNQDFGEWVSELVRFVLTAGFYLAVIEFSPTWAHLVVDSFMEAAQMAQGGSRAASAAMVMDQGITFVFALLETAEGFAWLLVGLVILLMFAAISAYMLLVMAEMYIVTAAGVLLLGFGGSDWTSEFAKRYLIYTASVGAKLFTLLLVVGFALGMFETWDPGAGTVGRAFALAGAVFVAMILVVMLPGMVQGIINGSSIGAGGPALTGMMTAVSSAAVRGMGKAATNAAKMGYGGVLATKAAEASVGASTLREAVAKSGGGMRGAGAVGARVAGTAGRAMRAVMGRQMAADGSVLGELKGMRAAAEAMRDAPAPDAGDK